jgi:AraC family transcriptional regulator
MDSADQRADHSADHRADHRVDHDQRADVFAAFVAVLAEALDDHAATGDQLARRLNLSRFHLDRVIASVAGEAPGQFRRRVLLERSAFRLLTTDTTILDVAVEAGYSSHEAFTRAFSRAYGAPPGTWRQRRTGLYLDSPNAVHFHPPNGLRLPAREKATSMDLLVRMVEHHLWLVDQMLSRAAQLTDEQLDVRIELSVEGVDDEPTLRSLLARLVGQVDMWNSALAGRDYDWSAERGATVPGLQERLAEVGPAFLAEIRQICTEGRLDDMVVCPGETVEVYTMGGMLAHVLTFAAHRRTLAVGALYGFGFSDLDAGDPIRWVAETA